MQETKICTKCKEEKIFTLFSKNKKSKTGYGSVCKDCVNKQQNEPKYVEYRKKRLENRKQDPIICAQDKEKKKGYLSKYRRSDKYKIYKEKNKEIIKEKTSIRGKEWYKKNKKRNAERGRKWRKQNPEKYAVLQHRSWIAIKSDTLKLFSSRIRTSLRKAFRKNKITKEGTTFGLLGFSGNELNNHLKILLNTACCLCKVVILTLENSNIDHIIPIASASSKEEILKLNQLSNLRLICAGCNLNKISEDLKIITESKNTCQNISLV